MKSPMANSFSSAIRSFSALVAGVAFSLLLFPNTLSASVYLQTQSVAKEIITDAVNGASKDSAAVSNREKSLQRTVVKDSDGNVVATSYGSILPTTPYVAASAEQLENASRALEKAEKEKFTIPSAPYPPRLVNDYTGILTDAQVSALETRCVDFANTTSNQVAIVILSTFGGYDKAELALKIGRAWGVGQSKYKNGIVMLVKPKVGSEKGEVYIAVGSGLEGALTDVTTGRIVSLRMIPAFKENDYYDGINDALSLIFPIVSGEITDDSFAPSDDEDEAVAGIMSLMFFLFVLLITVAVARKNNNNGNNYGGGSGRNFTLGYILGSLLNSSASGGSSGNYGGGSSGGGWSGGGFGGFGGGGFSGGGAGGSW